MSSSTTARSNLIDVGRICGVFGVKGWVKVKSSTEPEDNIFSYSPWWLKTKHGVKAFEVVEYQRHSAGLVVHLKDVDDRDLAQTLNLSNVSIERQQLKELPDGDFYWHQLIGLRVATTFNGELKDLGVVASVLETGANDVLVIKPDDGSVDDKERLVPYIVDNYVVSVNLDEQQIIVDWDPDF